MKAPKYHYNTAEVDTYLTVLQLSRSSTGSIKVSPNVLNHHLHMNFVKEQTRVQKFPCYFYGSIVAVWMTLLLQTDTFCALFHYSPLLPPTTPLQLVGVCFRLTALMDLTRSVIADAQEYCIVQ